MGSAFGDRKSSVLSILSIFATMTSLSGIFFGSSLWLVAVLSLLVIMYLLFIITQ
jgi:hypothetical protein